MGLGKVVTVGQTLLFRPQATYVVSRSTRVSGRRGIYLDADPKHPSLHSIVPDNIVSRLVMCLGPGLSAEFITTTYTSISFCSRGRRLYINCAAGSCLARICSVLSFFSHHHIAPKAPGTTFPFRSFHEQTEAPCDPLWLRIPPSPFSGTALRPEESLHPSPKL